MQLKAGRWSIAQKVVTSGKTNEAWSQRKSIEMGKHTNSVQLNTEAIYNKPSCTTRHEHGMEGIDENRLKHHGGRMGRHYNGLGKGEKWD